MAGLGSLHLLIEDPGPCPVCDGYDCGHQFHGDEHFRMGDPMAKHPLVGRREIRAPRRLYRPDGSLDFAEGAVMTAEEAMRHGIAIPAGTPARKKGRRQRPSTSQGPQGPTEDRAHHPEANRKA
jgi:hypothetical protein